ncbi:MAG TPA: hypothetical protein VIK12_09545 [Pengzhenrongella sp.]
MPSSLVKAPVRTATVFDRGPRNMCSASHYRGPGEAGTTRGLFRFSFWWAEALHEASPDLVLRSGLVCRC